MASAKINQDGRPLTQTHLTKDGRYATGRTLASRSSVYNTNRPITRTPTKAELHPRPTMHGRHPLPKRDDSMARPDTPTKAELHPHPTMHGRLIKTKRESYLNEPAISGTGSRKRDSTSIEGVNAPGRPTPLPLRMNTPTAAQSNPNANPT